MNLISFSSFARGSALAGLCLLVAIDPAPTAAQDVTWGEAARSCMPAALDPRVLPTNTGNTALSEMDFIGALSAARRCPEEGPPVFIDLWLDPPADSVLLRRLMEYSAGLNDERLFSTLLEMIGDRSRPLEARLAALAPAGYHADSTIFPLVRGEVFEGPPLTEDGWTLQIEWWWALTGRHANYSNRGAQPIVGDPAARYVAVLDEILERPDEPVRISAAARSILLGHFRRDGP